MCRCSPTGPPEGDREAGSVARGCSEGREAPGCAGVVCFPVEPLPATLAAQPQEMHQDASAQVGPGSGAHTKVYNPPPTHSQLHLQCLIQQLAELGIMYERI